MNKKSFKRRNIKRYYKKELNINKNCITHNINIINNNNNNNNNNNSNKEYKCNLCQITFLNENEHKMKMVGRCPNVYREKTSVITKIIKDYPITNYFDESNISFKTYTSDNANNISYISSVLYCKCPICMEMKQVAYIHVSCGHCICHDCLLMLIENTIDPDPEKDPMVIACGICRSKANNKISILKI